MENNRLSLRLKRNYSDLRLRVNLRWEENNFIKAERKNASMSHVSRLTRRVLKNLITFLRMWSRRLALRSPRQMFLANYNITTHKHAWLSLLLSRHPNGTLLDIYSNYHPTSPSLFCYEWIFHAHGSKSSGNFTLTRSTSTRMDLYLTFFCILITKRKQKHCLHFIIKILIA